jgi:Zn-dependent protease
MRQKSRNSIRLFRILGINVFLHWSWFLVAIYEIQSRATRYASVFWNVLEYLALFLIVLLHEFGHALACRKVGGQANQIVLWPLGGIAYVSPPQRPGAMLWSIAAGPLVNVAFLPVLSIIVLVGRSANWAASVPNADAFFLALWLINLTILIFNLLPIALRGIEGALLN